jgi:hypothetical protein
MDNGLAIATEWMPRWHLVIFQGLGVKGIKHRAGVDRQHGPGRNLKHLNSRGLEWRGNTNTNPPKAQGAQMASDYCKTFFLF